MDRIRDTILGCQDEWPMRVRRVYYVMMGHDTLPVPTKAKADWSPKKYADAQYKLVSDDVARLRVRQEIPWDAIDDTHRRIMEEYVMPSNVEYLRYEADRFLTDYSRNYYLNAKYYPEIWVEKDAASTVYWELASSLHIPLVILKGDSSITFVHALAERARQRMEERNQRTLVVYCSDLDPRGYYMLENVMNSLRDDMGIGDEVIGVRAILTAEQVDQFALPPNPAGIKTKDCRYKRYVEEVGDFGVELDALSKQASHEAVQAVINSYCGETFLADQRKIEADELAAIDAVREEVIDVIKTAIK